MKTQTISHQPFKLEISGNEKGHVDVFLNDEVVMFANRALDGVSGNQVVWTMASILLLSLQPGYRF